MTDSRSDGGLDETVTPEELYERLATGEPLTILDTRDRDEFESWHVDGPAARAVQIPHVEFVSAGATGSIDDLIAEYDLGGPIVAVCGRGEASDHDAALLREAGVEVANLEGGMEAWARTYLRRPLGGEGDEPDADGATVHQYVRPSSGCLAYLIEAGGEAVLVDPLRAFVDRYVEDARELGVDLVGVVDTHVHADHLSGLRPVAARTDSTPYLPAGAVDRGLDFDAELLADAEELRVGDATIDAVHLPGHTSEMTALRVGDVLLSGDSLFVESVARPDLEAGEEGAPELAGKLHESLRDVILELPDRTLVAPGHVGPRTPPREDGTYAARLGELRDRLDLLGLDREAFVEQVLEDVPPRPANYETIVDANLGRADVDEEAALELELGPNNCAVSA